MDDNIPGTNGRGSEDGLKWKEIFERTDINNRGNVLRSLLVNQLYDGAVSSCEIVHDPILGISIQEQHFQNLVLSPIEWFLFGGEPCYGRKKLLEINNPPTLCGKVFKNGEPTYSCRDCALDGTCVLCMQCFGKSIHKGHNYQLSTSSGCGGGCCDCGDLEAWKQGASCKLHTAIPGNSAKEDLLKKLPEEFYNRANCLIYILLDFCVSVICQPNDEELPIELKSGIASNGDYVTVLFNDESHTFDGVISGLTKAINGCTTKMALDFANVVDREGRSIICKGNFKSCDQVRISVEHNTLRNSYIGALRCETIKFHLIACQLIALRLMKWLSELTEQSDYLRTLHSSLCTNEFGGKSLLVKVLLADAKLWKAARFQTHQLLMNTLLKDPQGKVTFGIEFVKNYAALMDGFYADDQEHSISATVMTVQLFTVPSLVQTLVINFDALEVVIQVLLDKSNAFVGDNGVFDFQRDKLGKCRRLHYVVHDLKYILQNQQSEWNEVLKEKFLRFLELFLSFHRRFQGMDSIKRATGNHIEMEPDWHKGFNFQLNIAEILPLILKWAKSDRDVLLRSVSVTLKCLKDIRRKTDSKTKLKIHQEGKKSMKTFDFDVSSSHVSINISIVRFLVGLIEACEMYSISIPVLLEVKTEDDILMYLEYPLKVLAMVAQVKAGMWKRNGYSIQSQAFVYQKDLSREMYDKDIFLVQALVSCMDKDHFIVVLLDMFKLLPWSSPNFDVEAMQQTSLNQQLSVAGEFLHLLIIILGERYKCSVGHVNANWHLQRHVVHKLCLGTMSRSQLMQGLPLSESECNHGSGIDEVILSVATFKKPGLSSKGMYTLKKEYLHEFNPFFYHYSKNEQSKAEDCHRKRCKEEGIPAVFAPPVPVEFSPAFANIVDLLSCQKLVELLTIILWKIKHDNPRSWTDRIFHEVLHLIGLALHEETRKREMQESFGFLKAARKRLTNVCKYSLIECLEALQDNPIVEGYDLLLRWTIKKFNDEISARENPGKRPAPADTHLETVKEVKHDEEKILKQRLAKERRERVLKQMSNMQKAFIKENSELYLSTDLDDSEGDFPDAAAISVPSPSSVPVIAIGKNRTPSVFIQEEQFTCILCQEKPTTKSGDRPLVCSAYVQRSKNLSKGPRQPVEEGDDADPLVAHRDQRVGVHTSSCGHVMHGECWQRFVESMLANERLSRMLRIQSPVDTTKREFLCPLCECLSNTVVPLLPPTVPLEERIHDNISWLTSLRKIQWKINNGLIETNKPADQSYLSLFKQKFLTLLRKPLSGHMNSMITVFSQATFTSGLNVEPNDEDSRIPLMVWSTCAYTIQCLEHSSRGEMKSMLEMLPKREMDVLNSLVLLANSVGSISKPPDVVNHCLRLISVLPGCEKLQDEERSLLDIDLFDWMVKVRFSLPSIECQSVAAEDFNISSLELDVFVLHLALVGTLTQILLTTPEEIPSDEMDEFEEKDEEIAKQLSRLWRKLKDLCSQQPKPTSNQQSPQRLLRHVQCRLLPFLRCCAIFFHILNSTRVPVALKENSTSVVKEYDALSEYLALPINLTEMFEWNDTMGIFNNDIVTKMFAKWCSNCNLNDSAGTLTSFSLESNSLIKLPDDFSELICLASNFNCPMYTRVDNRVPAMCLVCGQMLCCDAFCCKEMVHGRNVGSCTAHAFKCGAGTGIFLRVRDCVVLLINGIGKGCFYPSPYLDAYGETDRELRRGNPLYLCHERYDRLKKLWKQHGIASEIARCLETNRNLLAVDWANN